MCELGAHTMDIALTSRGEPADLPVGEIALSILAPNVSTAPAAADTALDQPAAFTSAISSSP
jgi:hypothetical protein